MDVARERWAVAYHEYARLAYERVGSHLYRD